jgi:hypothetical protein
VNTRAGPVCSEGTTVPFWHSKMILLGILCLETVPTVDLSRLPGGVPYATGLASRDTPIIDRLDPLATCYMLEV